MTSTKTERDYFCVVGCEQYGDWSYIPVNQERMHATVEAAAERFAEDLRRSEHRKHVHLLAIKHEDPGTSHQNEGPWVCVFLRDGHWTITNGMHRQADAQRHADRHLLTPVAKERHISRVTVRRLPLPKGYSK